MARARPGGETVIGVLRAAEAALLPERHRLAGDGVPAAERAADAPRLGLNSPPPRLS